MVSMNSKTSFLGAEIIDRQNSGSFPLFLFSIGFQIALSLIALLLMGFHFGTSDEYCRLWYSIEWLRSPFLAPEDHIWLGGNFWILGLILFLVGDPVWAGILHGLVSGTCCIAAAWFFSRTIGAAPLEATFACALITTRPIFLALSKSSQPGLFFLACFFLAGASLAKHFQKNPITWDSPSSWLVMGTLCVIASQTLRYEGWFLSVPWGLLLLYFFLACIYRKKWEGSLRWMALGVTISIFPLIWLFDAKRVLGSWTTFISSYAQTLIDSTPHLNLADPFYRALFHPFYTLWQLPDLWVFAIWGLVVVLLKGNTGSRMGVLLWIALALILETMTTLKGTGKNWPFRYVICFVGPMALLAGMGMFDLFRRVRNRSLAKALFVGVICLDLIINMRLAPVITKGSPPTTDMEYVAVGKVIRRLSQEGNIRKTIVLREPFEEGYWDFERWVIAVHAGLQYEVSSRRSEKQWQNFLQRPYGKYAVTAGPELKDKRFRFIPTHTKRVKLYTLD